MSGVEHVAKAIAGIQTSLYTAAELVEQIKQRQRWKAGSQQAYDVDQLQKVIDRSKKLIDQRFTDCCGEIGPELQPEFRVGDSTARGSLMDIFLIIQTDVIQTLQMAVKNPNAVEDWITLNETVAFKRQEAMTALDALKKRICEKRASEQNYLTPESGVEAVELPAEPTNTYTNSSGFVPGSMTMSSNIDPGGMMTRTVSNPNRQFVTLSVNNIEPSSPLESPSPDDRPPPPAPLPLNPTQQIQQQAYQQPPPQALPQAYQHVQQPGLQQNVGGDVVRNFQGLHVGDSNYAIPDAPPGYPGHRFSPMARDGSNRSSTSTNPSITRNHSTSTTSVYSNRSGRRISQMEDPTTPLSARNSRTISVSEYNGHMTSPSPVSPDAPQLPNLNSGYRPMHSPNSYATAFNPAAAQPPVMHPPTLQYPNGYSSAGYPPAGHPHAGYAIAEIPTSSYLPPGHPAAVHPPPGPVAGDLRGALARPSPTVTVESPTTQSHRSSRIGSVFRRGHHSSNSTSGPSTSSSLNGRPCKENEYWGYCKGSWAMREEVRKGLSLANRPSGLFGTTTSIWQCKYCEFHGPVFGGGPGRRPKDLTIDPHLHSSSAGPAYFWIFLAKSHVKMKDVTEDTSKFSYGCIICTAEGKKTGVFGGVDTLMSHIQEEHSDKIAPDVQEKTKCILGRDPEPREVYDLKISQIYQLNA